MPQPPSRVAMATNQQAPSMDPRAVVRAQRWVGVGARMEPQRYLTVFLGPSRRLGSGSVHGRVRPVGSVRHILVVGAEPDVRPSTERLHRMVTALADRDGVDVSVWFLRAGDVDGWWPGARVVD